jgi:hypothetical protein
MSDDLYLLNITEISKKKHKIYANGWVQTASKKNLVMLKYINAQTLAK